MMLRLGGDRRRVARGLSPDRLIDAEEFLMRIRSGLHVDTGRNVNVLSYELQEKAVDRLRYAGGGHAPARRSPDDGLLQGCPQRDPRARPRSARRAAAGADADSADRREPDVGGRRHHVRGCGDRDGGAGRMAAGVRCRRVAQRAGRRRCARAHGARAAEAQLRARGVPPDARTSASNPAVHAAACRARRPGSARCATAACWARYFPS